MSSEFPYEGASINWGEWARLDSGQWRRTGQDQSERWFEEYRNEEPAVPRQPLPMGDLSTRFSNLTTSTSTSGYYSNEYPPHDSSIAHESFGQATAQQRVQDNRTGHKHQKAGQADHRQKGKAKRVDPAEPYRATYHGHDKSKNSSSLRGEETTSSRSHASKSKSSKGKAKESEAFPSGNYNSSDVKDYRDKLGSAAEGPGLVPLRKKHTSTVAEGTQSLGLQPVTESPIVSSTAYLMTPIAPRSYNAETAGNFGDDEPPGFQAALNQSAAMYQRGLSGGESSRTATDQGWPYGSAEEHHDQVPELPSPLPFTAGSRHSRSHSMDDGLPYDEDWSKYIVEKSKKFKFGSVRVAVELMLRLANQKKVFKVMWSEPMGFTGLSRHNKDPVGSGTSISEWGQRTYNDTLLYEGIRRFIVVDGVENGARNGNSICIPIATYKKQGCTKAGLKAVQHGIIHTSAHAPMLLPGEPELGVAPIRLILNKGLEGIEKLAPQSRVNYSKHVTIEHNSSVYFIGKVHLNDLETLERGVDSRWETRIRDRKRHQRHRE